MKVLKPKNWTLGVKLSITIISVVTFVGILIGAVMIANEWKRSHEVLGEKALLLAETIATAAPKSILRKEYWPLYQNLKHIETGNQEVTSAMILDSRGLVLAHINPADQPLGLIFSPGNKEEEALYLEAMQAREPMVFGRGGFDRNGYQEGVVPIFSDQKYLGVIRVRLSAKLIYEEIWTSAFIAMTMVLLFVILGSGLGILISRHMVEPLAEVTRGLEAVGRGEMTDITPITINTSDEIGRLSQTFNQIMIELAEKKHLEDEIAMTQKLVALGRITAGVAHEINNPLAGLLNCVDTLRSHPDDPNLIKRYLPVIDQGLHRIKDIVHNLLVGLKFEEGEEIVELDHIDKLYYLMKAEIKGKAVRIDWNNEVNPDLPVSAKLEQIVCNLLKNAIEALGDEGVIGVRIFIESDYLTVEVKDNGPGIPIDLKQQLFDPFFTTKTNGTGLGLWVVYRLTQSLNGVIEFESGDDGGTVFYVSVPVISKKVA